jgi:hypothetical protein
MLPALPIISAAIPPAIDVSFGLMPLAGAIIVLAIGVTEIIRAMLSSRAKRSPTPRFARSLPPRLARVAS